ncbi:hypothetical protein HQ393_04985 [Chitinibacter bivalviorum]|uniref:HTH cro/C1-type domain-containing protein n=1 Tax=Chitinibacter bivalviorum TaxID=2739434 RepID=A0A7H9BGJ6_9NEIS|nr:CII family transcriptional regulator [Chitinibacter bivalviorum]QLG87659.1 hypothetical protein HQ393_04985 [Chitinibacter bivalviorum]
MSTSLQQAQERSRQIESQLLAKLAETGQVQVADRIGVDQSTISKWKKDNHFLEIGKLLTALGLKLAEENDKVVNECDMVVEPSEMAALKTLARKYLLADELRGQRI